MTTRTVTLLAALALVLGAVWVVARGSSTSSAPSPSSAPSTRPPEPAPLPDNAPTSTGRFEQAAASETERGEPPVPRRDIVPRITRPGMAASVGALPAREPARRPIPAEATAAAADAHRMFREGDFASARAAADGVLAKARGERAMVRIAAVSACALGDADGAAAYLHRADRKLRSSVELACADHGVRLPPPESPELTRDGSATRSREPRTR